MKLVTLSRSGTPLILFMELLRYIRSSSEDSSGAGAEIVKIIGGSESAKKLQITHNFDNFRIRDSVPKTQDFC